MTDPLKHKFEEEYNENLNLQMPPSGHEERFREKLFANTEKKKKSIPIYIWYAAAAIFLVGLTFFISNSIEEDQQFAQEIALGEISPQHQEVEANFQTIINNELAKYNIQDPNLAIHMKKLNELDEEYKSLKKIMTSSPKPDKVIEAMIVNYESRLRILQHIKAHINYLKNDSGQQKIKENA